MTALRLITLCDEREPNQFDARQKLSWLYELDLRIARETGAAEPAPYLTGAEELLLDEGQEELYLQWLIGRISAANGEAERYNRSVLLFNDSYGAWLSHFIRSRENLAPAQFRF